MGRSEKIKAVTVERLLELSQEEDLLHLRMVTGDSTLKKEITTYDINRPGLALAGDYDFFDYDRIQVFGRGEYHYLMKILKKNNLDSIKKFFSYPVTCIIFSNGHEPPAVINEMAEKKGVPMIVSSLPTNILTTRLTKVLEDAFAPSTSMHGVLVEVFGVGILIIGKSGVGKSECALELIERGHRLVADDVVDIQSIAGTFLSGSGAKLIRHHMEIRGLGIININHLFGVGAIRDKKQIQLVVNLEDWAEKKEYDRLGLEESVYAILGVEVPLLTIPVRPGRNIPILIETAAMNFRLHKLGYNTAKEFNKKLMKWIEEEKKERRVRLSWISKQAVLMMIEKDIIIKNKTGLHARPAAIIVQRANEYRADIFLEKDGDRINAKSIMGVMMLAAAEGATLKIIAEGEDEMVAVENISTLLESDIDDEA